MTTTPAPVPPPWRDLLGPAYAGPALILATGVLIGAVNIYLASSLLPTIIADIGGDAFYAWNMTAYLVAMVIATMLVSRLQARRGDAGAYRVGCAVFLAGSLVCAAAPQMPLLLAGRALQGLGAGLLSGLGFTVIRSALPQRLWTRGSALMSAMYGIGNFAGPALGGLLAQAGAWRPAFALMAVVAAACALLAPRLLPAGRPCRAAADGTGEPVPAVSLLLATAATAAVSLAAVLPGTAGPALAIAAALPLLIAFAAHERRTAHRVFPRAAYRLGSPLAWVYLTIALLACGVAVESFVPLFAQRLGGLGPAAAGFLGAALSLGWSATQLLSSSAAAPRTIRRLHVAGPLVLALGLAALALLQRADPPAWLVLAWVPALLAAGAGIGLAYPHLSVAAMSSTRDPGEGRRAAAAVATVTSLAIAFGTAAAGALVRLGGPAMLGSARLMLYAFALLCALGAATACAADRTRRRQAP
ncbi:MFS transporter [Nocardiopsis trehalosi]|jgi:MFS family permease|uniref:MFS transporter n=1 Tax=Nocardiopsis trehalosi TaxID=109329 RepID=UPI00082B73BF|nr:MFS transporter [Nocardiopsis trehalosi]